MELTRDLLRDGRTIRLFTQEECELLVLNSLSPDTLECFIEGWLDRPFGGINHETTIKLIKEKQKRNLDLEGL